MNPLYSFELLFFAVFGQTTTEQTRVHRNDSNTQPAWTNYLFKIVFGIYMLVSVVVLINLLIAMMSDTYQRIQVTREQITHVENVPTISMLLHKNFNQSMRNNYELCCCVTMTH